MSKQRSRRQPRRRPAKRRGGSRLVLVGVGVAVLAVAAIVLLVVLIRTGSSTAPSTSTATQAQGVDGIKCERSEQTLFHIHAHLAIFVRGQPRTVPYGIGIPDAQVQQTPQGPFVVSGSCFSWLHSHTEDGLIHVESPVQRTFTLGDYFDVWGQPLSVSQVGSDAGPVTAYLNGQRFSGNPRSIPLQAHAVIQLDVGSDVAPSPYAFPPNT